MHREAGMGGAGCAPRAHRPPTHPTPEGRARRTRPVPARGSCTHEMAAEARRSIWKPGLGEGRKWPPQR